MAGTQPSAGAWFQRVWRHRGLAAWLLRPLATAYGTLVRLNAWLYRTGWRSSERLPVPVVVVGNVVAGGGGKTPVVMATVAHLQSKGLRPGIVSRGYGRRSTGPRVATADSTAEEVGDEPALLARRCGVPVVVAARRAEAGRLLLARFPDTDVLVCDDGLQHHALARDAEICVFGASGTGNGWLLPAGPLREPWPRAVDFVLHTAGTAIAGAAPRFALERQLAPAARTADGREVPLESLAAPPGTRILAVAGIAQPEDFFAMLRAHGLRLDAVQALPDHFDFDSWKPNVDVRWRLICTEKDAVKLWRRWPEALAVALEVRIDPAFFAALDARLAEVRRASLSSRS